MFIAVPNQWMDCTWLDYWYGIVLRDFKSVRAQGSRPLAVESIIRSQLTFSLEDAISKNNLIYESYLSKYIASHIVLTLSFFYINPPHVLN